MKKILIVMCCMATMLACDTDFDQINTNPNVPTEVPANLLLSGVLRNTINDQVNEAWGIGNIVVQHTAKIQFVNEDRYRWGERNGVWNSVYGNMRNVYNIIEIASNAEPVQNNYLGIALILKSWMFANLTDAYGDVPYTDALKGKSDKIYLTTYDSQDKIYDGILADLKKGVELLGTSTESVSGDLVYGGSIDKWKKLGNSLRLRYLMRISNQRDVKAEMQAIVGDPGTTPIFENNEDNAVLVYDRSAPNQWPMYTSRVGSFDEFRLSKNLGDKLFAMNDPRLAVFGRPTENSVAEGTPEFVGVPNGLEDTQALDYNGGPQNVSRVGYTFACLVCNDNGQKVAEPNIARGLLMTFAELQFILAEAREKAMITTGDAEDYYRAGIDANFEYYAKIIPTDYGIDLTVPDTYFDQDLVAYTGTQQEKLTKIGTQKWIALFFNGLEAWYDWRRTGIPTLEIPVANLNGGKIPVRYIYPQSEQSVNAEGRSGAVARQGEDTMNTPVWWDKE